MVASQALRMSHYCNQSEFGVVFPTFIYCGVVAKIAWSGGKRRLSGG